jgi:hypothetical protein
MCQRCHLWGARPRRMGGQTQTSLTRFTTFYFDDGIAGLESTMRFASHGLVVAIDVRLEPHDLADGWVYLLQRGAGAEEMAGRSPD